MQITSVLGEWDKAIEYADEMLNTCKWSPATNAYQVAVLKYMQINGSNEALLKQEITDLMRYVVS